MVGLTYPPGRDTIAAGEGISLARQTLSYEEPNMASTAEALRSLYGEADLAALDKVREALLSNPAALDNHKSTEANKNG